MPFDYSCLPNLHANDSASILSALDQLVLASEQGHDLLLPAIETLKEALRRANILLAIQNPSRWTFDIVNEPLLLLLLTRSSESPYHPYQELGNHRHGGWAVSDLNGLRPPIEEFSTGLRRKLTAIPSLNGTRQAEVEKAPSLERAEGDDAPANREPIPKRDSDHLCAEGRADTEGPFDSDGFRFAGVEVRFRRAIKQYRLVTALWDKQANRPAAPRAVEDVINEVWGEDNDTGDAAFRQLCSDTRRRFEAANCHLDIQLLNGTVCLIPKVVAQGL